MTESIINPTQQKKQKIGTLATKNKKIYFEYDWYSYKENKNDC